MCLFAESSTKLLTMSNMKDGFASLGGAYSGRIIGAVVKAFDLKQGVLTDRTAKRFYAGKFVSEHSQYEILEELARALIERCISPVPPQLDEHDVSMVTIVSGAIALAAVRWDDLLANIQSRSGQVIDRRLAAERFLRLVIVDLSVRIFAFLGLCGIELSRSETPSWAEENGGGKLLRHFTKRAGLTRDQLAARLGVFPSLVDNWLDGKHRPEPQNIERLAVELARTSAETRLLEQQIKRQYSLAHIADLLVPWIGRERVLDMSTALARFVWLMAEDVRSMDRPPIEEAAGAELIALCFGTAHPSTHVLLQNLAQVEKDLDWKKDILAAAGDWSIPFEMVALQAARPRTAAGLAQDLMDITPKQTSPESPNASVESIDGARENLRRLMTEDAEHLFDSIVQGDFPSPIKLMESGIATRRDLVRDSPLSPEAHYQIGSFLGLAGKNLMRRDLVDEGITECKIAAALQPNWDAAAVEPGIILANIGEFEEALLELKDAEKGLQETTPHLRHAKGYVLMELSRFPEALVQIESVMDEKPDFALTVLYAARCAFALGDNVSGLRYAKTARGLGEPSKYLAWKSGKYSSRKRR